MSDEALISNILHDLAGMMTSVEGLAQIVETQRDHPAIDELTAMLTSEARKASEAVKDLQLVRALAEGSPVEALERVTIGELFLAVRDELSEDLRHGFTPPPPGLPDVFVDRALTSDLIARCYAAASETNPAEEHHVRATVEGDKVEVVVDFGPTAELAAVLEGRESGRKGMRGIAIAHRLLPRWRGAVEARVSDASLHLVFALPIASEGA